MSAGDDFAELQGSLSALVVAADGVHPWHLSGPYGPNPPIDPGELAEFEAAHGVRLPEDYREFLTRVGNGGRWPGLVQERLGWIGYDRWRVGNGWVGPLAAPFTLYGAWNDQSGRPKFDEEREGDPEYERAHEDWEARHFDPLRLAGAMPLHDYGRNQYAWLVVTGPLAGRVYFDNRGNDEGIFPILCPYSGGAIRFLDWFRARVESAGRRLRAARLAEQSAAPNPEGG
jgi:hypothetical protein